MCCRFWLIPDLPGGTPGYQQAALPLSGPDWTLLASGLAGEAPLHLGSDTRVAVAHPAEGARMPLAAAPGRKTFVQILDGMAEMEGERIVAGDGLQFDAGAAADLDWISTGSALRFDLAA